MVSYSYREIMMPAKDPDKRRARHKEYIKNKYHQDTEYRARHKALVKKNRDKNSVALREIIKEFKQSGCALCPETTLCCMSAHHVDPTQKDYQIGKAPSAGLSPSTLRRELSKCICLCENCHRKLHAGLLKLHMKFAEIKKMVEEHTGTFKVRADSSNGLTEHLVSASEFLSFYRSYEHWHEDFEFISPQVKGTVLYAGPLM